MSVRLPREGRLSPSPHSPEPHARPPSIAEPSREASREGADHDAICANAEFKWAPS